MRCSYIINLPYFIITTHSPSKSSDAKIFIAGSLVQICLILVLSFCNCSLVLSRNWAPNSNCACSFFCLMFASRRISSALCNNESSTIVLRVPLRASSNEVHLCVKQRGWIARPSNKLPLLFMFDLLKPLFLHDDLTKFEQQKAIVYLTSFQSKHDVTMNH